MNRNVSVKFQLMLALEVIGYMAKAGHCRLACQSGSCLEDYCSGLFFVASPVHSSRLKLFTEHCARSSALAYNGLLGIVNY